MEVCAFIALPALLPPTVELVEPINRKIPPTIYDHRPRKAEKRIANPAPKGHVADAAVAGSHLSCG